ncbi:nucleoporin Nup43-like [Rhagoletis pomonella]|uniref:nucleoporin Nup43-like n=1 Tax=Rhagoletis pomonella TaxID=28610 RepID=UPI001787405D|nr:nucleoporin Nup43-like [Rhagoletis pomonella]XP_036344906.1 nucleoporin Nup43-like [Rhagoletis pomonella]
MDTSVNTFFVSEKISKIRWLPEKLEAAERFLTGSWEMPANFVRLWRLQQNQYADDYNEFVPRCCDKQSFNGDVTGLEFIANDLAVVSCADGRITILHVTRAVEDDVLKQKAQSDVLHKFEASGSAAPCTAISAYEKEIATVGEDGRLNIVDANDVHKVRRTIEADSIALTALKYVNPREVLTANRMGVIRMFDVRASADEVAVTAFMTSCEEERRSNYVSAITSHPTQPHIVLAGSEEGSITVWDLRQPGFPASYLSAHTSAITEIGFHHREPSKLFTAAEGGELWLWKQQSSTGITDMEASAAEHCNPWLNGERAKSRINVTSLISNLRKSINTFDASGSKIICGSDSEAIYFIDSIY